MKMGCEVGVRKEWIVDGRVREDVAGEGSDVTKTANCRCVRM